MALSYNEAFFYPTEMLRIPIGLRICRPVTGLVYTDEKVKASHFIWHLLFQKQGRKNDRPIQP
jgi:hypothetical protein